MSKNKGASQQKQQGSSTKPKAITPIEETSDRSADPPKRPFSPEWRSIGIGIVVGMLLMAFIDSIGGRIDEWNFGILKLVIPTATLRSTPTPPTTALVATSPASLTGEISSPSALVSMSFRVNGWNPRVIDFRTASAIGIKVGPGDALNFFDIWVNTPRDSISKGILIEFYANDIFIGKTENLSIEPGLTKLPGVSVEEKFADKNVLPNYWKVENSWETIDVVQIHYDEEGRKVAVSQFPIKLNPESASWLISPPDVSMAGFAYTIYDGPETWIDLYDALASGLTVNLGEKFKITQILYRVELPAPDQSFGIEASLFDTKDSYVNNYDAAILEAGTHVLSNFSKPFEWVIDENSRVLSIRFARSDGTVLDYLEIPLNK